MHRLQHARALEVIDGLPGELRAAFIGEDQLRFTRAGDAAVAAFARTLEAHGIRATVRRRLGADINASCGQLRRADAAAGQEGT